MVKDDCFIVIDCIVELNCAAYCAVLMLNLRLFGCAVRRDFMNHQPEGRHVYCWSSCGSYTRPRGLDKNETALRTCDLSV